MCRSALFSRLILVIKLQGPVARLIKPSLFPTGVLLFMADSLRHPAFREDHCDLLAELSVSGVRGQGFRPRLHSGAEYLGYPLSTDSSSKTM